MYEKGKYKGKKEAEIKKEVEEEGFDPIKINDPPGRVYSPHTHPETKLLAILAGSMNIKVGGGEFKLKKGDKLVIEGNVKHSAVVGDDGCVFFWSEKLM